MEQTYWTIRTENLDGTSTHKGIYTTKQEAFDNLAAGESLTMIGGSKAAQYVRSLTTK